eukprot:jgi/Bigna1/69718/fgenesh1_pg.9_\
MFCHVPLFRSEEMRYVEVSVVREKARQLLGALGLRNLVHIIPSNDGNEGKANELKELKKRIVGCSERRKLLKRLEEIIARFNIKLSELRNDDEDEDPNTMLGNAPQQQQEENRRRRRRRRSQTRSWWSRGGANERKHSGEDSFDEEIGAPEGAFGRMEEASDATAAVEGTMMIPMRSMRRSGASSSSSSLSSSSMRRRRKNIERDTLQEFDEEIRPLESEIEQNLKSIRALRAQESRYREAQAVLTQCSQEYLHGLEEGYISRGEEAANRGKEHQDDDASRGLLLSEDNDGEDSALSYRRFEYKRGGRDGGLLSSASSHDRKHRRGEGDDEKNGSRRARSTIDVEVDLSHLFVSVSHATSTRDRRSARFEGSGEVFFNEEMVGEEVEKSIFTIITSGREIPSKLAKIVKLAGGRLFNIPKSSSATLLYIAKLKEEIGRFQDVIKRTRWRLRRLLRRLANPHSNERHLASVDDGGDDGNRNASLVKYWHYRLERERLISQALMKCRQSIALLSFSGWVPKSKIASLHSCVDPFTDGDSRVVLHIQGEDDFKSGGLMRTGRKGEQVDKSVSEHRGYLWNRPLSSTEVNPGAFTIVTFPFTFGVMYGDMGHGFLLMVGALWLIWSEKRLLKEDLRGQLPELLAYPFHARYALLPMGVFALYCGSIYNDCLSVPLPLFNSSWVQRANATYAVAAGFSPSSFMGAANNSSSSSYIPYPYGVDPGTKL